MDRGEKVEIKLLIKQAKNGDKEALLRLVMAQQLDYYKLAYVYMKNEDDALDAIQDMIVIIYENIHKLKNDDAFYSWSKTILVNSCKSILRKNKKIVPLENIREEGTYEIYENPEDKIVLEKYLSELSPKHQEIIRLKYFLDLDYETIGQILKIPIGTVKSRMSVGMRKLKESMGGEYLND
ncbi:RNA polymerase sigma factor [Tissierella sp. MSJ-40]|uniref:RNA polymerase sigma factor n=1 Tax=Tissierella simiarum TaxID=2841534 RepID=A0ABS6E0V1_9FIRM|nr:RNA polymerase sigma factor [Tissierella simiarum]